MSITRTGSEVAGGRVPATQNSGGSQAQGKRRLLRLTDVLGVGAVVALTTLMFSGTGVVAPLLFFALALVWLEGLGLYRARELAIRIDEWRLLAQAIALAFASTVVLSFLFAEALPRTWTITTAAGSFWILTVIREVWRVRFHRLRGSGEMHRRTVLVGANPEANMLSDMLDEDPSLGYQIVHRVDPTDFERGALLTTEVLSSVAKHEAVTALISGAGVEVAALNRLCRDLVEAGVHVELSMSLIDIMHRRLTVRPLGRFPVAYLEPVHRDGWRAKAKRTFDVVTSVALLTLLSPIMLVIALAVRFSSDGPIIFRQTRVGRDGRSFDMLKFRSMVQDAEEQLEALRQNADSDNPLFKMKQDPRITRIGGILRRTSLDELPQLFNVIRGEMSLVGPRPALRHEMVNWSPELYGRLRVQPGITGLWQVSGRSEASFDEYTRLDLYYVDNWSLTADLQILARTASAVVRSDGAY